MKKAFFRIISLLLAILILSCNIFATVITVNSPNVEITENTKFYNVNFLVDGVSVKILSVPKKGNIPNNYLPNSPSKEGYKFAGWTFRENDPAAIVDFSTFEVDSDMYFYAYWDYDFTIRQDEEIYHSDIYWTYPRYMKQNLYLISYNADTFSSSSSVINEYIETPEFLASAIEHGIDTALSPSATGKMILDKAGVTNFQYNEELDKANEIFVKEVFGVNLESVDQPNNKYIKKLNEYLGIAKTIDQLLIEEEAANNKTKPELYKYFTDMMFDYMIDKCKNLSADLPSMKSQVYTALSEATELLGTAADAADFAKGIGIAILMQDVQLEMVQDIIDTQPKGSTLYNGMTRLKTHLRKGAVSYFMDTNIYNKVVDDIVGYLPEKLLGTAGTYGKVTTIVVKSLNSLFFDILWDVDYYDYATSCVLQEYSNDFYTSLINHASCFDGAFGYSDIEKFQVLFDAYVSSNRATLTQCKKIAKYNDTYNTAYVTSAINNFCGPGQYDKFVDKTKEYLRVYSDEVLAEFMPSAKYNIVVPQDTTYYFKNPSDEMSENSVYARNGFIESITINKGGKVCIERDFEINKLTMNGTLTSSGFNNVSCNYLNVVGDSNVDVPVMCNGILNHSSGNLDISKNITVKGDASLSGTVNQTNGTFVTYGDISGGSGSAVLGDLCFAGKLGQTVSRPITVKSLTNNNPKGITVNAAVTVNGQISSVNPITNGKNITLTETASFADDSYTGDITVAGLTGEFPSEVFGTIYMTGGNITQSKDMECTSLQMSGGTLNIDNSDTTITGVFDFGAGTVNLTKANLTVKSLQKAYASGGTINIDADSKYSNITDAVISGTVTGDGTYYVQGDLTNNGTVNVGSMIIASKLPTTISGNNINTANLSINSPKGVTINNKINVSQSYTSTGKVVNPTNILFSGGSNIDEDVIYTVPLNIEGDLIVDGKTVIAKDDITVKGNIVIQNGGTLITENLTLTSGSLTVSGDSTLTVDGLARMTGTSSNTISVDETSEIDFRRLSIISTFGSITNNGTLRFGGDTSISSVTLTGSGTMYLRGDLYSSSLTVNRLGKLVLNGLLPQKLSCSSSPTFDNIVVSNPSRGGVTFNNTFYYYETYEKGINTVSGTVSHKEA